MKSFEQQQQKAQAQVDRWIYSRILPYCLRTCPYLPPHTGSFCKALSLSSRPAIPHLSPRSSSMSLPKIPYLYILPSPPDLAFYVPFDQSPFLSTHLKAQVSFNRQQKGIYFFLICSSSLYVLIRKLGLLPLIFKAIIELYMLIAFIILSAILYI